MLITDYRRLIEEFDIIWHRFWKRLQSKIVEMSKNKKINTMINFDELTGDITQETIHTGHQ